MDLLQRPHIVVNRVRSDFSIAEFDRPEWRTADSFPVNRYWSGDDAPAGRHAVARLLWSETALYVRFDAAQTEPLVAADAPNLSEKTLGLWDRDVCEVFIAPDPSEPRKYYEFEAAPTGEWVDLTIDLTSGIRRVDVDFVSGMSAAGVARGERVRTAMRIPFKAFGKRPMAGNMWLGNLFRCVGTDPSRGYLAYNPTETAVPNFHVPEKFVRFEFRG